MEPLLKRRRIGTAGGSSRTPTETQQRRCSCTAHVPVQPQVPPIFLAAPLSLQHTPPFAGVVSHIVGAGIPSSPTTGVFHSKDAGAWSTGEAVPGLVLAAAVL